MSTPHAEAFLAGAEPIETTTYGKASMADRTLTNFLKKVVIGGLAVTAVFNTVACSPTVDHAVAWQAAQQAVQHEAALTAEAGILVAGTNGSMTITADSTAGKLYVMDGEVCFDVVTSPYATPDPDLGRVDLQHVVKAECTGQASKDFQSLASQANENNANALSAFKHRLDKAREQTMATSIRMTSTPG